MLTDRRTAVIDNDALRLIFDRLHEKVVKRAEDEKHAADRHQRRAVDALRSRIKHLEPPIRSTDTWDIVRSRVERSEEYRALESEALRISAFEKVTKRLKEKEEDTGRERDRRRSRRGDERNAPNGHHANGRRRRSSKTPEVDAYEADRRKAMADREKQYRKTSSLGLTPPPVPMGDRDRERNRKESREDRHGRLDRSPIPRHLSHYDRERRDREDERERLYRTRGDPRGSRDELNYGEELRSVSGCDRRRRRGGESDGESMESGRRSSKRHRRGGKGDTLEKRDRSPAVKKDIGEPVGVHSGSEEGEIEED